MVLSCRKDYDKVSQVQEVSYPTINFTGNRFVSIQVGGTVPTIEATAYDSLLNESYTVNFDPSVINTSEPGLYVVPMTATNRYGFVGSDVVYIAVTNIHDSFDLSGIYSRVDVPTGATPEVTEIANGLYQTDDVGGAPSLPVTAYFVQINDSVLDFPTQPTSAGPLSARNAKVLHANTDSTALTWVVVNINFGTAQRYFLRQ